MTLPGESLSWANVPTALLRAELERRQEDVHKPKCGSGDRVIVYNTWSHVGALFLILFLSTLACSFPIIVKRFPDFPVPHRFLFLSRHFGTGVLVATAFIHLMPTAFISMTDPCLPWFWNKGYPPMAGLISMTSVLTVVGIEMFFATKGAGHVHGTPGYDALKADELERDEELASLDGTPAASSFANANGNGAAHASSKALALHSRNHSSDFALRSLPLRTLDPNPISDSEPPTPLPPRSPSVRLTAPPQDDPDLDQDHEQYHDAEDMPDAASQAGASEALLSSRAATPHLHGSRGGDARIRRTRVSPREDGLASADEHAAQQRALLQCLLLEAGILFHSVFIGLAVSVATGTSFMVLLVAISFHQTFEGLALGSRIAAVRLFGPRSARPWLMALAYGATTPLGQAIGLAVHRLYDPASQVGLLMVGVMNGISSGLLLFAGLVELLAEDFLSERSYASLKGRARLEACAAVVAGAFLMAFVGAWA